MSIQSAQCPKEVFAFFTSYAGIVAKDIFKYKCTTGVSSGARTTNISGSTAIIPVYNKIRFAQFLVF
jgi:hypothetical protein